MAFIPVANCIQANLRLSFDGQEVENVLHFATPGVPTLTELADVAEGVEDWWITNMVTSVPSTVVFREVYATDQTSATGASFTAAGGNGTAGTAGSPAMPNNVTIAMSLRTAFRGRSYRGRIYHIGLTEASIVDNELTSGAVTALNGIYALLLNSASFGGAELAVASRYLNNAPRVIGVATPVISILLADPVVDSQRRRLPGRGR